MPEVFFEPFPFGSPCGLRPESQWLAQPHRLRDHPARAMHTYRSWLVVGESDAHHSCSTSMIQDCAMRRASFFHSLNGDTAAHTCLLLIINNSISITQQIAHLLIIDKVLRVMSKY